MIIDEAGMADTLSLDTAVQFIIGRSGSVRLVMINNWLRSRAGRVFVTSKPVMARSGSPSCTASPTDRGRRDSRAARGPTRGTRLLPGPATGRRRPATTLDAVFNGWQNDRNHGLDAIMLAPTQELVSQLNQRARKHRLAETTPSQEIELGDGNWASIGDLIITRRNDRRLRITATDWVKNGTVGPSSISPVLAA